MSILQVQGGVTSSKLNQFPAENDAYSEEGTINSERQEVSTTKKFGGVVVIQKWNSIELEKFPNT